MSIYKNLEKESHIYPDYPKIDITNILNKKVFSEKDYKTLFYQTGLGKTAINEIKSNNTNYIENLIQYQEHFFKKVNYICKNNSIISKEEFIIDNEKKISYKNYLAPIHNGYVLITKSSHTLFWRNGHAAIVVDEKLGKTLEAVVIGENSKIQDINKWKGYSNFIILKLNNVSQSQLNNIADYALNNLNDIPYNFTVGILNPKYDDIIKGTHCSHLVWSAFYKFGFDIDFNKGLIVTPNDILKSPSFEVVQIFGFNPKQFC